MDLSVHDVARIRTSFKQHDLNFGIFTDGGRQLDFTLLENCIGSTVQELRDLCRLRICSR